MKKIFEKKVLTNRLFLLLFETKEDRAWKFYCKEDVMSRDRIALVYLSAARVVAILFSLLTIVCHMVGLTTNIRFSIVCILVAFMLFVASEVLTKAHNVAVEGYKEYKKQKLKEYFDIFKTYLH
ncbi:MAG: hypothetical protein LBD88_05475 [Candidatus Peribacteria bacterium]|nr:hypothetical protein [Candidatus Peribacteria bacterium]